MVEYIEREAAIKDAIAERDLHSPFTPELSGWRVGAEKVANRLAHIPAADVVKVRHGWWSVDEIYTHKLSDGTTVYEPIYKCSVCGRLTESYLRYDEPIMPEDADFPHYCPHCGAKMDGEQDE